MHIVYYDFMEEKGMKRTTTLFMAAAMAVGISTPAIADFVRLSSVDVGYRAGTDTTQARFGGRMEGLQFIASRSDSWDRDHHGDGDRDHHGDWDRGGGGDWVSLGTQSFEGHNDHDSTFAGWAGRHVDRIGLRPVDGDARCMSVVATFEGGEKVKLVSGVYMMERGQMAVFDLPGYHRNLAKLYMRCRAEGDYSVSIEMFTRK